MTNEETMLVRLTPKSTRFGDRFCRYPSSLDARQAFAVAFWMLP